MSERVSVRAPTFNEKRYKPDGVKRSLLFILLLGAVILAVASVVSGGSFEPQALVARLGRVREEGWLVPLYFVLFGATSVLAPAFVFFVTAGALWGFWPGCAIGWLAANGWAQVHFMLGRGLGRSRVARWLADDRLSRVRHELEEGGALAVIVVRQLPLPFVGVNLVAGASPLKWTRWSVGNAAGLLPAATVYAWSAASIVAGADGARGEAAVQVGVAALALVTLGVGSRLAWRGVRRARGTIR